MHHMVCPLRPPGQPALDGSVSCEDKLMRDCLKKYYPDERIALGVAEELAKKHPTMQFVVLSPSAVMETLTPQIVRKKITESGELVLDKENAG